MNPPIKDWRVVWEIDVSGNSPAEAAREAMKIMRDPSSLATIFDVRSHKTNRVEEVDLTHFAICDNCGHFFKVAEDGDFACIPDLNERILPGEMVPVCECPKCKCLAYPANRMIT